MSRCVLCGSGQKKFLFFGRDRLHAIPGTFKVVRCQCGLIRLDPQPSMQVIGKYYPKTYYAYDCYVPGSLSERFAVFLYKLFFTLNRNPLRLLFLPFKHLLRGTQIIPGGKILDVGCGNGAFLHKMRAAGMDAYGVEFSKDGYAQARKLGLNVKHGTLEQQKYPSHSFDVITLNHVFEHLPDPVRTLKELKRILKPQGRIIIAVPNSRSLAALFGRFWSSLELPRHLFIPNPQTMRLFAKKAGLKMVGLRYISFPAQFQTSITFLLNAHRAVPLQDSWLNRSRLLYWLFLPLVYVVDFLRIGDVIEVTLQK